MPVFNVECDLVYAVNGSPADFVFNIEVAHHHDQRIISESLRTTPPYPLHRYVDPGSGNRLVRLAAEPGELKVYYEAVVETRYQSPTQQEEEIPVDRLPLELQPFLWPTRYCESDSLFRLALLYFGQIPRGYGRVAAIYQWVRDNIQYQIGTTGPSTSVRDVLIQRAGVCRDYAHTAIALCRALNIPARLVTGYARYEEPPPDFHAMLEVYLGGRWILFDPTLLSPEAELIRICTARDAADAAFATLFGPIRFVSWRPEVFASEAPISAAA